MIRTLDVSRLNSDQINIVSEQIAKFESYHLAGQGCEPTRAIAGESYGDQSCNSGGVGHGRVLSIGQSVTEEVTLENVDELMRYQPWMPDQLAAGDVVREALVAAVKAVLRVVPRCPNRTKAINHLVDARMDANAGISFRGRF